MQHTSLKRKTFSGLMWSFADLMANQGIQFLLQIILARLLLPEHFGLIGMILVFIAISNSIVDSGFTQALIREKESSQEDYSTVFYFNLLMSLVMYAILFFSAVPISSFFHEPRLVLLLRILSLVIIINSFGIIQRVILIKKVDFRTQTKINITAGIISGTISIIFALTGFGVWSLVIKTISMQLILSLMLWLTNKWWPSFVFNFRSFKRFFGFGSKLLISGLIDTIYKNIYFVIIGRLFAASQLGYYTNAVKFRDVASQSITSSIQRVTYPVLSRLQEDETRLRKGYRKVIKTSSFIIFPIMIGLAAIADPLINLLLGQKWVNSIIYFQLLCLAGMLYPIHALNLNILQVKGRSDLFLLLEVIKKALLTILIILAIQLDLGINGLIGAAVVHSFLSLFLNTYFSAKEISYSIYEQIKDLLPVFLISLFMGILVLSIGNIIPLGEILKLIIQIFIGVGLYIAFCYISKIEELFIVYRLIQPVIANIKTKISH